MRVVTLFLISLYLTLTCQIYALTNNTSKNIVNAWLPYWRCEQTLASVKKYYKYLDQVSPFSYEVDHNGKLIDTFKKKKKRWHGFLKYCHIHGIKIIPTIFWTDTEAMHCCLSRAKARAAHCGQIKRLILKENFDGININYERVRPEDREHFLEFIKVLSSQLHAHGLVLHCSIGGRTSDTCVALITEKIPQSKYRPAVSLSPGKGKISRQYKRALATYCDQIHIMGYDEWGLPARYNKTDLTNNYYISHASNLWIDRIIQYALSYIPAHKLTLGIPTYGLEFIIYPNGHKFGFKKVRNITYKKACMLARQHNRKPNRTAGGELAFTYRQGNELRYVCFLDSIAFKDKLYLAQKYRLKGISIFKIDGLEEGIISPTIIATYKGKLLSSQPIPQ